MLTCAVPDVAQPLLCRAIREEGTTAPPAPLPATPVPCRAVPGPLGGAPGAPGGAGAAGGGGAARRNGRAQHPAAEGAAGERRGAARGGWARGGCRRAAVCVCVRVGCGCEKGGCSVSACASGSRVCERGAAVHARRGAAGGIGVRCRLWERIPAVGAGGHRAVCGGSAGGSVGAARDPHPSDAQFLPNHGREGLQPPAPLRTPRDSDPPTHPPILLPHPQIPAAPVGGQADGRSGGSR